MSVAETSAPIALDVADGVARLRLNRPEASNGMNVEFLRALHEAALACHADPAVRVVLLTGEGRNFCAGGDIHTFESKGADLPDYLREATAWLQLATAALIQLRVPVVARCRALPRAAAGWDWCVHLTSSSQHDRQSSSRGRSESAWHPTAARRSR